MSDLREKIEDLQRYKPALALYSQSLDVEMQKAEDGGWIAREEVLELIHKHERY